MQFFSFENCLQKVDVQAERDIVVLISTLQRMQNIFETCQVDGSQKEVIRYHLKLIF